MILPKLALITGASSGLGRALAQELSQKGTSLILTGRNEERLRSLVQELPSPARYLVLDLSTNEDQRKLLGEMEAFCPDLVINNAGFGLYGEALNHPLQDQLDMIDVNIKAVVAISLGAAQTWKSRGKKGTILNVASAAAYFSYPTFAIYAASKAFVLNFSTALDEEVSAYGIRVLTVCPGQIDTDFRRRASHDFPQKKDRWTMPVHKAVELILEQITNKDPVRIIDWRYRCSVFLSKLLPKRLLSRYLRKQLVGRFKV